MPQLPNARHERFAQEVAKGASAAAAYHAAGYRRNRHNARRLITKEHVAARVAELQRAAAEHASLDRAWVLARLRENVERAMTAEPVRDRNGDPTGEFTYQGAVANKALELIGKDIGMFVDRAESTSTHYVIQAEREIDDPQEWARLSRSEKH